MESFFVRQVLFSSPLSYGIPTNLDLKAWILCFLSCGDTFSTQLLCSTLHKVCDARNTLVAKIVFPNCHGFVALDSVHDFIKEYLVVAARHQPVNNSLEFVSADTHIAEVDASLTRDGFAVLQERVLLSLGVFSRIA